MENKNETNLENVQQETKSKKGIIIFIVVFLTIFLIGICFITFKYLLPKDNDINQDNNQQEDNKQENIEDNKQSDYKYELEIYKSEGDSVSLCEEASEYCNTLAFTIKTETKDAKLLTHELNSFIIYQDNGIKIYDTKNDSIIKTEVPTTEERYDLVANDTKVTGIIVNGYTNPEYYNIEKNKRMYVNKYESISAINEKYLVGAKNMRRVLLSANEEKEVTDFIEDKDINDNNTDFGYSNKKISYNDKNFYVLTNYGPDSDSSIAIYDNNKNFIAYVNDLNFDIVDNYVYISINDSIKKYDIDGKLVKTVDNVKEESVKRIIRNYIVSIKDDNTLSLINIDTKEEKKIATLKDGDYIDDFTTGYYSRDELDSLNEKDKTVGIYVVVYYKDKDAKGNYGMEYCYTDNKEIKEYPIDHEMGGRAKPVLYLYPTKETKVKVEFVHPEYLTTTYPKYKNKWEVVAKPNGDLFDKDNKYYYALYWDEVRYHEVDFKEGFYVTKDNAINFLEDKLNIIGLNAREANEFIMYFLPILENNEKSLVYFELTKEREQHNKLIITPKPDSLLRVTIHIKKVNKETSIKEEKLETFKRVGFSAVEWGGMLY